MSDIVDSNLLVEKVLELHRSFYAIVKDIDTGIKAIGLNWCFPLMYRVIASSLYPTRSAARELFGLLASPPFEYILHKRILQELAIPRR